MRCLLLESSDRLVLIDNGIGHKYSEKFARLYNVNHDVHTLDSSLKAHGFTVDDVSDLILTHLHFDHVGGTTGMEGDQLELVFRNARHFVQRAQWESASDPNPRERASFLEENLAPLRESEQLVLVEGEGEILPGLTVLTANGHTDKMQMVQISDDERTLVYVADLIPTIHHFGIPWTMAYDIRPLESMSEKERFLRRAAEEKWSLFFEHDIACEVCSVELGERGIVATSPRSLSEL